MVWTELGITPVYYLSGRTAEFTDLERNLLVPLSVGHIGDSVLFCDELRSAIAAGTTPVHVQGIKEHPPPIARKMHSSLSRTILIISICSTYLQKQQRHWSLVSSLIQMTGIILYMSWWFSPKGSYEIYFFLSCI